MYEINIFQVYLPLKNWFYNRYKKAFKPNMIPDKELIDNCLNKIVTSKYFVKSKISCDLLVYLTQATLEGKNPKEYTIGIELFGKKYDEETKPDSNIRVYIHNVRKKLKEYYENEGSKDPIILAIEKGKYKVRFETPIKQSKYFKHVFLIPFLLSISALGIVSFYFIKNSEKHVNKWKDLPVWQDFSDNGKNTLLVLGDYFVFSGILPTGHLGVFRDFSINSQTDFEHLLDKNPDLVQSVSKSNLTYLSKMAVFCQSNIYKVFAQTGGPIDVKLSSDLQPDDLKNNNIIFVGNYKNMGLFENLIKEMKFSFEISHLHDQYIFAPFRSAGASSESTNNNKETDYALVISTEGFSHNRLLFFLSTKDIGNISTVNLLTNAEYLKSFVKDKLQSLDPNNFKALYKVEGINKTDLSFELIRVE